MATHQDFMRFAQSSHDISCSSWSSRRGILCWPAGSLV